MSNKDFCIPRRFKPGDYEYDEIWTRVCIVYNQQLAKVGMLPGSRKPPWIEVDMEIVDGEEKPWPLTTHDETLYGDGCLADGTRVGSDEAARRSMLNMKHIFGVMNKKHQNVPWNWTKGRAAEEEEDPRDIIHKVGEKPKLPGFPIEVSRCRWPVPTVELKERLDRESKKGSKKPFKPYEPDEEVF